MNDFLLFELDCLIKIDVFQIDAGMQLNGLTQGAAYGDDFQDATNYPSVRIVNTVTGHVFNCKTHNHSGMGVATAVLTCETGRRTLVTLLHGKSVQNILRRAGVHLPRSMQ